jgi:protein TonB
VLGGILAVSAWKIGDVPEPNVPIMFAAPAAPPAAAGGPGAEEHHAVRRRARSAEPAPVAVPPQIPAVLPPITIPKADLATLAGSEGDIGGTGKGVPGGIGEAAGDAEGEGAGPGGLLSAKAPNVVAPRLLYQVQPEYPEAARRARLQGAVILQAVIGTDGDVDDVHVLSSASPLFDEPAERAVRRWRYAAATLDRRAVRVFMTVTIFFTLH